MARLPPYSVLVRDLPTHRRFEIPGAQVAEWLAGHPMRDALGASAPVLVGFAAETVDVVERARTKRAKKNVDIIVANDVSGSDRGFDVPANEVTIITADDEQVVPLQHKNGVAARILDRVEAMLMGRATAAARR